MDRATRLFLATAVVERTRDYTEDAFNGLFEAMDGVERRRSLIPKLTPEEEAEVAIAAEKLARGERLPELEMRGPLKDFLPEPDDAILARLRALPQIEQDRIFTMIVLLINIDRPPLRPSPAQIA